MLNQNKVVALIPLRGGSKSIPLKNIKPLAGQPLCYWAIKTAQNTKEIDEVWVSTDHPEIKQICLDLGVKVLDRPEQYSTDLATTDSVMVHFKQNVDFDILVTLQATSPLTRPQDISAALEEYTDQNYDSMLTAVEFKRFLWDHHAHPINYDPQSRPMRQQFKGYLLENGAFYITSRSTLEKYQNRLGGRIGIHIMPERTATELDEPHDWEFLAHFLEAQSPVAQIDLSSIKHIFSDFDGVLTDNTLITSQNGIESVITSKTDSLALSHLLTQSELGFTVISKETNPVVAARCSKLNLPFLSSIDNKNKAIQKQLDLLHLDWKDVCYIGNDLNDLSVLKKVGLAVVPQDAAPEVKKYAHIITKASGGHGVIRELLTTLVHAQKEI